MRRLVWILCVGWLVSLACSWGGSAERPVAPEAASDASAGSGNGAGSKGGAGGGAAAGGAGGTPVVPDGSPDATGAPADGAVVEDVSPGDGVAAPGDILPAPRGPCPELAPGMVTFRPGETTRQARVWISDAAERADGPLLFYWYGTNGSPAEAEQALGAATIADILAAGGLVVAPVHDPAAGIWPWHLVAGSRDLDVLLADEIVACAAEKVGIDRRRIHSVGFSAGAIHTVQLGFRRSGYIASVVTYSGAMADGIPDQDPTSKLAAMILHGGPSDRVVISFQAGSERYKAALDAAGRFAVLCNHGMGHRIPAAAAGSAWRFLRDHPFGTTPPPYADALPAGFLEGCAN